MLKYNIIFCICVKGVFLHLHAHLSSGFPCNVTRCECVRTSQYLSCFEVSFARRTYRRSACSLCYMQQTCPSRYSPFGNSAAVPELCAREREGPNLETDRLSVKGGRFVFCNSSLSLSIPSRPLVVFLPPTEPCFIHKHKENA
jgi:hypothetical protein